MQQQVVLGEEPSEQQSMPLLVSALCHEQFAVVAELATLRPQAVAEHRLVGIEVPRLVSQEHTETVKGGARGAL